MKTPVFIGACSNFDVPRPRLKCLMRLSIIIPALNEASTIINTLAPLQPMRERGVEVILVDGGSADSTLSLATPLCDLVLTSAAGRARQMNAGAQRATGTALLFLHADSWLPANADHLITQHLRANLVWGRFDVTITGTHPMLPVIAWFMNHRSRLTGIATGDQGIFVTREAFDQIGGFADQPLMEDIALSRSLGEKFGRHAIAFVRESKIMTSGRRWEKHGVWRTILLMWRMRLQYYRGANPNDLHKQYYGK